MYHREGKLTVPATEFRLEEQNSLRVETIAKFPK